MSGMNKEEWYYSHNAIYHSADKNYQILVTNLHNKSITSPEVLMIIAWCSDNLKAGWSIASYMEYSLKVTIRSWDFNGLKNLKFAFCDFFDKNISDD